MSYNFLALKLFSVCRFIHATFTPDKKEMTTWVRDYIFTLDSIFINSKVKVSPIVNASGPI